MASSTTFEGSDAATVVDGGPGSEVRVGARIGRYVVLEEVGHGAMGRVRRAYDPKLQREVALKSVRREALGHEGALRLVAEAQALAKLSDPHVVAVYDVEEVGAAEVVLVMEYVAGRTLTAWLREDRSWDEIVALFRRAGRGLAAAHAASLLHRDFKPDNVLVASGDVVKVTDFGLAKTAEDDTIPPSGDVAASSPDHLTATGVVLGTPRYMAPEQHRGETLTPAADQYAFCVALFEALAGRPPFDGRDLAYAKMRAAPAWPGGPTPRATADAILRGLAPEPSQRWPSMNALLAALARDPRRARRRGSIVLAGLGAVVLATGVVYASSSDRSQRCTLAAAEERLAGVWDDDTRTRVRDAIVGVGPAYARGVSARIERTLDTYASGWTQMHVDACEATAIRGEQSEAVLDLRMACLQRANVDLAAVARVLANADPQTVQKADDVVATLRPLSRCADVDALQAGVEPPLQDDADAVESIRASLAASKAARAAGKYRDAQQHVRDAEAALENVRYESVHIEVVLETGIVLAVLGEYTESETRLREALRLSASTSHWDGMLDAATVLLSVVGYWQRKFDDVSSYAALARGLSATDPEREARVRNNLALGLLANARYEEAEREQRRVIELREQLLPPDHPDVSTALSNLGNILDAQGKLEAAERQHRSAQEALIRALGADHPRVAQSHHNLALTLGKRGDLEAAEVEARRALAIKEAALGPDHAELAPTIDAVAMILFQQGELEEAETLHRRALALMEASVGANHPRVATSLANLGAVLDRGGRLAEAETLHRRALAMREALLPTGHPDIAFSHTNLANVLRKQERVDEAVAELRTSLALLEAALDTDDMRVAKARVDLATLLPQFGAVDEARALAETAWQRHQRDDVPRLETARTALILAELIWKHGTAEERPRAIELAELSQSHYTAAGKRDGEEVTNLEALLAEATQAR